MARPTSYVPDDLLRDATDQTLRGDRERILGNGPDTAQDQGRQS
jgi:hypothetical protein